MQTSYIIKKVSKTSNLYYIYFFGQKYIFYIYAIRIDICQCNTHREPHSHYDGV